MWPTQGFGLPTSTTAATIAISSQAHNISSPYEITTEEYFMVTAEVAGQTADADVYVLVLGYRFPMSYNATLDQWEATIKAGAIGMLTDVTVYVCVSDADAGDMEACANAITIKAPVDAVDLPLTVTLTCEKAVKTTLTLEEE